MPVSLDIMVTNDPCSQAVPSDLDYYGLAWVFSLGITLDKCFWLVFDLIFLFFLFLEK